MPMTMKAIRIEKATLISTTSGMPLAPVAASTKSVLEPYESHDLTDRVAARHHDQKSEQHDRQSKGEIFTRQRIGLGGHPQHQDQ